jgi:AcrR family transcriptional regulator
MRKPNVQLQADRRDEILRAATRCFVRAGFHGASMHDICAEAGMSPGNLYRYFPSKEAIIAGIAEHDRAEVFGQFASADQADDFIGALEGLARHHFAERTDEQVALCAEIMAESRRNPEVSRIFGTFDADVKVKLCEMIRAAGARGDVATGIDVEGVVQMLMTIADGVWWRRALDPEFDADALLTQFMSVTRHLLGRAEPVAARGAEPKASRDEGEAR